MYSSTTGSLKALCPITFKRVIVSQSQFSMSFHEIVPPVRLLGPSSVLKRFLLSEGNLALPSARYPARLSSSNDVRMVLTPALQPCWTLP